MTSLRKLIYTGLLALVTLSLAPALASAQESRGQFTLTHSVLWEKAIVPPGQYVFSFKNEGTGLLTLTKLDNPHAGFMFIVTDTEQSPAARTSKLTLHSIAAGSYVTTMTLANDGITLHFTPPQTTEKVIASNGSLASGR